MGGMERVIDITGAIKHLGWTLEWKKINKPVNQNAPWYIMVEGADGAGKSSLAKLFEDTIKKTGAPVRLYHEPFYPQSLPEKPTAEDYQLDRERWYASHQPDNRTQIVSDRSLFSTLAYNACPPEVVKRMTDWLNSPAYFGSYNRCLILLHPDEQTLLERLKNRQNEGVPLDALEVDRSLQAKVSDKYLALAKNPPFRVDVTLILKPRHKWRWRNLWK